MLLPRFFLNPPSVNPWSADAWQACCPPSFSLVLIPSEHMVHNQPIPCNTLKYHAMEGNGKNICVFFVIFWSFGIQKDAESHQMLGSPIFSSNIWYRPVGWQKGYPFQVPEIRFSLMGRLLDQPPFNGISCKPFFKHPCWSSSCLNWFGRFRI